MYDYLNLHFTIPQPVHEYEAALDRSLAFAGSTGQVDETGCIRVEYRGLRIEYRPDDNWGRVRGSLHSFAQGSNVGVFTAAEVARACIDLASSMNLPAEVFVVKRLEAGVNLVVPTPPLPFLESLSHHKKSPFWPVSPPAGCLRPLEYYANHMDYKLKYYDKGTYTRRQGKPLPKGCHHLLRFEVVFTRARGLHQLTGREPLTLADLPTVGVLASMADCLHQRWQETVRRVPPDYAGLPFSHASLLHSGNDLDWWEAVQPTTPLSTFKANRMLYLRLQREAMKRVGPHPYDLLLPEHLQVLRPGQQEGSEPEISTVLHTCNQLEIGKEVKHEKQEEHMLWRGSSSTFSVGERTQDKLPPARPMLRAQKVLAHEAKQGEIPKNPEHSGGEMLTR